MVEIKTLGKLMRWKEYYGTVIVISALGVFLVQPVEFWKVFLLLFANLMSTAFAYMLNDVEDAEDDKHDEIKGKRNPVSAGEIKYKDAFIISIVVGLSSLLIYYHLGYKIFIFGFSGVLLGYLYSYRKFRLKSKLFLDILSHGFFLGLMFFITAILLGDQLPSRYLLIWLGTSVFLASALSDLNNEMRDYGVDKKVGLKNTAIMLGITKYRLIFCFLGIFIIVSVFAFILIFSNFITKLVIAILATIVGVHYMSTWSKYRENYYQYNYHQLVLGITGVILLFNSAIVRIPETLLQGRIILDKVVYSISFFKTLLS